MHSILQSMIGQLQVVAPSTDFIIRVKTDNAGTSASDQFTYTGGIGDYDVLAINQSTFVEQTFTGLSGAATLTFSEGAGTYILKLTPTGGTPFNRLNFSNAGDKLKITELINWGSVKWTGVNGMYRMFHGCANMICTAVDVPDLSEILLDLGGMRAKWFDATGLTSISYQGADFSRIIAFGALSSPTGKFFGCTSLTSVDYRDVTWNTTDGIHCGSWFQNAPANVQGLGSCNIKPTALNAAFTRLTNTNIDLSAMNTVLLTNVSFIIDGNTNIVTLNCTGWDWSSVTTMAAFARNASNFQEITGLTSGQDFTSCTTFQLAFTSSDFNQLFEVNLRLAGVNLSQIFSSTNMSTANYTDTIVYWANYAFDNAGTPINVNMTFQSGRTFDTSRSGGANFADAGAARTYLTGTCNWTFSGDTVI